MTTTTTAVWSDALQAVIDAEGLEVLDDAKFVFRCASVCGGSPLHCYCACRVPYDDTKWVLAVAPNIGDRHDPQHAIEFRFPFQLPLYPKGDVAFVAVTLKGAGSELRPLYLADVPPVPIRTLEGLTAREWLACEAKWASAFGNTCAVLSAAFDNMWDCTIHAVGNGGNRGGVGEGCAGSGVNVGSSSGLCVSSGVVSDPDLDSGAFVSTDTIEEVDYDVDEVAINTSLLLSRPSSDDVHPATIMDDLLNDDDESRIDIHTGLVASGVACADDNDDDMESIDGDTDADDDEEEEDEEDEDDDDEDVVE